LSWITILRKREAYRQAFAGFDAERVARFNARKVEQLLGNPGIVRNRLKVESAVKNARAFRRVQDEFGSFAVYQWRFVDGRPRQQGGERGEGSPVPRAIRRLLRANDIRERGDGDHQTAEIVLDDVGLQVVIAGGPGWHERNVEIAELRRQIDELHVVKEGCVTGDRQPRGRAGTADLRIHRPQGGGERVRFSERRAGQMSA